MTEIYIYFEDNLSIYTMKADVILNILFNINCTCKNITYDKISNYPYIWIYIWI